MPNAFSRSNSQRLVHLEEVEMAAHLDRTIAGVDAPAHDGFRAAGIELDIAVAGDDLARRERPGSTGFVPGRIGSCTVTSLVPSGKVASTCSIGISSATPGITSSVVRMVEPNAIRSATERPSRAPSRISSAMIAVASG